MAFPQTKDLPKIYPQLAEANSRLFALQKRDAKLVRKWAIPGTERV